VSFPESGPFVNTTKQNLSEYSISSFSYWIIRGALICILSNTKTTSFCKYIPNDSALCDAASSDQAS